MKLNRRSFITSVTTASISLPGIVFASPPKSHQAGPKTTSLHLLPPPGGYSAEAERITEATIRRFWDPTAGMFKAPVMSAEAVASDKKHDRGYVFWPGQIALHSLIEGAKSNPVKYAPQIWRIYSGMEQYFNAEMHAYNAWTYFTNNNDAYYDDNAWAVITLAEAHIAVKSIDPVHAEIYRNRAIDIMSHFVYSGWDSTGMPGGERWGTDPTKAGAEDKTVSATAGAALAALTLARAGWNPAFNIAWAAAALSWIWSHLKDTDNLIQDGLKAPHWEIMQTKWTYNTGVPMRAYVEHYRLSGDKASLEDATILAKAAIDRTSRLYDGLVKDPAKRFLYDATYFVHYLIDGLLQVSEVTPDSRLAAAIIAEARREVNYAYHYIRDPRDNFYWRNWRLWSIGPQQLARWEVLTGQTTALQTDPTEKSTDGKQWVKTLLANAGASRMFWLAARLK